MEFGVKDLLYIIGIIITGIASFFVTKHGLKDYIRDKYDELNKQIHELNLKLQEHKSKDDLQQQVIDQIGLQMNELISKLMNLLEKRKVKG